MIKFDNTENGIFIGNINIPESPNNIQITDKKNKLNMPKYKECVVYIYPGAEGVNVPYFHIYEKNDRNNSKTNCAIMIADNRYFSHGSYKGILNPSQCAVLNDWMNKLSNDLVNTNWLRIKNDWNENSPANAQVTSIQPNYSFIKPYKE